MRACHPAGKTHRACVWHAPVSRANYRLDAIKLAIWPAAHLSLRQDAPTVRLGSPLLVMCPLQAACFITLS